MIIWFIGLSSAGKTTVGRLVYEKVKQVRNDVLLIDGDELRSVWGGGVGHTREDRYANCWRYCRLSKMLDKQGLHVICSVLCLFEEHQKWNREHLSSYFEVYLDVPMETLRRRDEKDLYAQAEAGEIENVVGIDIPFEEPDDPDLVLENGDDAPSPSDLADQVLEALPEEAEFP